MLCLLVKLWQYVSPVTNHTIFLLCRWKCRGPQLNVLRGICKRPERQVWLLCPEMNWESAVVYVRVDGCSISKYVPAWLVTGYGRADSSIELITICVGGVVTPQTSLYV